MAQRIDAMEARVGTMPCPDCGTAPMVFTPKDHIGICQNCKAHWHMTALIYEIAKDGESANLDFARLAPPSPVAPEGHDPAGWKAMAAPAGTTQEDWDKAVGYDPKIQYSPDAKAWAQFFIRSISELHKRRPINTTKFILNEEFVHGWFANAMQATGRYVRRNKDFEISNLSVSIHALSRDIERLKEDRASALETVEMLRQRLNKRVDKAQMWMGIGLATIFGCASISLIVYGLKYFFRLP